MEKILIIDFGSQYTQLIARRVRELNVYCEILSCNDNIKLDNNVKGIILSGSPFSVNDLNSPKIHLENLFKQVPVIGICFGAQYIAFHFGGRIESSKIREFGKEHLKLVNIENKLLQNVLDNSQIWMSHGDSILETNSNFEIICSTQNVKVAGFKIKNQNIYGLQFHPEVYHTSEGSKILSNFLFNICYVKSEWIPKKFIKETIQNIKNTVGKDKIILGLSGGVDSSVVALLLKKSVGEQLFAIFVDNGLLRKNEYNEILSKYKKMGLNVIGVDAKEQFYRALKGVTNPEEKRIKIGNTFIEIFDKEAHKIKDVKWLAQGTIYPDLIESISVNGPSLKIKSHHNVGGLPKKMNLKLIEPLCKLFKDEVRKIGSELELYTDFLNRHPFPGPGLAIRLLGEVTEEKLSILKEADSIFIDGLKEYNLYDTVWQAGVMLLPVKSVGIMGDKRTYENVAVLRAVVSTDGMTADWSHLPYTFLSKISNRIINNVRGINRVVYDISSKPPSTIEWE